MELVAPRFSKPRKTSTISNFMGLNRTDNIQLGEFISMSGLSSDHYPFVSQRKSRAVTRTLTKPNGYLIYEGKHYYVDGTKFFVDGVEKATVDDSEKVMISFNGFILMFPDKKAYDTVAGTMAAMAAGVYPAVPGSVPDIISATTHMNRVFGVKDRNIYASKHGNYGIWAEFGGLLTDSYATDIEVGTLIGATAYQSHVVMFSQYAMYELYGYNPSNFKVQETIKMGLLNKKSIIEFDSQLYFAGSDGIYVYTGGFPRRISDNLNISKYIDVVAGTDGKKLFCSIYDGSVWGLYVYNPELGQWHYEDSLKARFFVRDMDDVYAVTDTQVIKFNSGAESVTWSFTTDVFFDESIKAKSLKRINILAEMAPLSSMSVYVVTDGGVETLVKSISATADRVLNIPIRLKRSEEYKIKVVGTGDVKIKAIQRITTLK